MRFSGAGMPTSASRSMARLRAAVSDRFSVGPDRLDDLVADPVERIEAGQRILEDHADPLAPDAAHFFRRQMVDPRARQIDLAAGDAAGRIDQPDHGEAGDRFAGAGFADHAEHFALGDVEGNAVDRAQRAAAGEEFHLEVTHGENGMIGHRSFGLSASRSQSPSRLMERISPASAMPGKATIHHSPANR